MRLVPVLAVLFLAAAVRAADRPPQIVINAPYVTTPPEVVDAMVKLAGITRTDVVYDLGCGDGRIVIAAVKAGAARGTGIDISEERIREARENAARAGLSSRIEFRRADIFETDFREATAVIMYLMPELNMKLRDRLRRELRPGSRVVSHAFDMGDWKPDAAVSLSGTRVFSWIIR